MLSTRSSLPAGAVVPSWNRWRASRSCGATDSSTCRSTPGRQVLVITIGIANSGRNTSAGLTVMSSSSVTTRRTIQPTRREQRHEQVVEREHLVAQHREPVEVLGPLVVLDRRDRRLQRGDVRFERDRDLVAEAALHAREHDARGTTWRSPTAPGRARPASRASGRRGRRPTRRRGTSATARSARRAARRTPSSRTRAAGRAARRGSRASPCARATAGRGAGRQPSVSCTTSSPCSSSSASAIALKRDAWSSNIVW